MAGPGDHVLAQHAFLHRAQFQHRRLRTGIPLIDQKLDPDRAGVEGVGQHQEFGFRIDRPRAHVGVQEGRADLNASVFIAQVAEA